MPCPICVTIRVLLLALTSLRSDAVREDVLQTRDTGDGASIELVRIHPPPRDPQTDRRGVWQFVLRYRPAKGEPQVFFRSYGPEDDLPPGRVPEDPLKLVEVSAKGQLLAFAYNAHGYCWLYAWEAKEGGLWQNIAFYLGDNRGKGALAASADRVGFAFAPDGSITATLQIDRRRKSFVLKPENRRSDPGYPYPWRTPEEYFVSPWREIPAEQGDGAR